MKIAASFALAVLAASCASFVHAFDAYHMLCLVNEERENAGLRPLGMSQQLIDSAQDHCEWQARESSMSHYEENGSTPQDRIDDAGSTLSGVAENIAFGYSTEEECMSYWMDSDGHRRNILGDYTIFGAAVSYSGGKVPYYTQDFGNDGQDHDPPTCS